LGERGRVAADRAGARDHILIGLIAVVVGHSCLIFLYVSSRLYSGPLEKDQRTTSGPADSILRAKGRRHDRTHDQRNAEIALDQRAPSRHDKAGERARNCSRHLAQSQRNEQASFFARTLYKARSCIEQDVGRLKRFKRRFDAKRPRGTSDQSSASPPVYA